MRRLALVSVPLFSVLAAATVFFAFGSRPRLPFNGTEAVSRNAWQELGGLWSEEGDAIFNRSDELGAKLVVRSASWADYKLAADMKLLGHHGEVGVIVRANEMTAGINAYRGYYAGFRSMDNSLILGYSDHDWVETRPVPLRSHVMVNDWMHINVVAFGCNIGAELTVLRTGEQVRSLLQSAPCVSQGSIGLRSLSAGAAWRNISAARADRSDLDGIRRFAPIAGEAVYPTREDDLVNMLAAEPSTPDRFFADFTRDRSNGSSVADMRSIQTVASLNTSHTASEPATLRGVVTHLDPLYIQDGTGGVAVRAAEEGEFSLGDETQITGQMLNAHNGGERFDAQSVRVLWDGASPRPVTITSEQAASGLFDGSLVEVSGRLVARDTSSGGRIRLRMSSGREQFSVIVQQSLSHRSARAWEVGSTLRVRGVNSASSQDSPPSDLFQILPRSLADITVVSPPPWTSGVRLLLLVLVALLLLGGTAYVYLRAERWKMRAVYEERERLAADMHDTLAQGFAGVGYQLQSLRRGLRDNAAVPEHLMRRLDAACELATDTHRDASTRITALHFAADEEYDVLDVLKRATVFMLGSESTLEVRHERSGSPRPMSPGVRDALFRIGHEAIANVLRHSRASCVLLRLAFEDRGVRLEIVDDGIGFEGSERNNFGIDSMRGRAEEIGGQVSIRSAAGHGTAVSVEVPYERPKGWLARVRELRAPMLRRSPSKSFHSSAPL